MHQKFPVRILRKKSAIIFPIARSEAPAVPIIELFAVQPYMTLNDYVDHDAFYRKIESLFAHADGLREDRSHPALIAFPEDIATFLALAGQQSLIASAATIDESFRSIGRALWRPLLATMARWRTLSVRQAFFGLTASTTWKIWHHTMSDLARRFAMTTVAGSALIPENARGYDSDQFQARNKSVYNLSVTYGPDGRSLSMTRKVNLVPGHEDILDLSSGPLDDAIATATLPGAPSVSIATAICYDSFTRAHTASEPHFQSLWPLLDDRGASIAVVPSANPWPWDDPWPLDQKTPSRLRKHQWAEESLPAALAGLTSVRVAMNPHLLASLLDVHFDGQSAIWARRGSAIECLAQAPSSHAKPASECVVHTVWQP